MSTTTLASIGTGVLFGMGLTASGVSLPIIIIGQMQMRDFRMLQVFLTASAASAVVLLALEHLGIAQRKVRPNSTFNWFSRYDGNIIGGALIGIGMVLTGACPGTVVAQLGNRVNSSLYVVVGGVLGAAFHAKFGKSLVASCQSPHPTTGETVGAKLKISPMKVFLAFEAMCTLVVGTATWVTPKRSYASLHPVAGGLLIGGAQAMSILLTDTPLGVSTAYDQIGRYIWRALGVRDVAAPPSPPQALMFALGILGGSAALSTYMPPAAVEVVHISKLSAIVGGFAMIFGARAAGGCTSGHGISGLSAFSFSSLVTVTAMFGAGIVMAMLWT